MTRVLLTGASGFLGRHTAHALKDAGCTVRALLRTPQPGPWQEHAQGDVTRADTLDAALTDCHVVVHCAGLVSRKPEDAARLYEVHVAGTKHLLDAAARAGVHRFVHISTSGTLAVSEDARAVATEESEPAPGLLARWPYYRTKLFAEQEVRAAAAAGMPATILNPSLLLGPGDVQGSSTGDVRDLLEGKVKALPPGGLSYVDARDVAQLIARMVTTGAGRPGQRYLLTACNETVADFAARVCRAGGVQAPAVRIPARAAKWLSPAVGMLARAGVDVGTDSETADMARHYWYADASLAESELGWAPRDVSTTLHDTIGDMRARGSLWPRH